MEIGYSAIIPPCGSKPLAAVEKVNASLRLNPNMPGTYRLRAACLAEAGDLDAARRSLEIFARYVPDATISALRAQLPLRNQSDMDRYCDILSKAGILGKYSPE